MPGFEFAFLPSRALTKPAQAQHVQNMKSERPLLLVWLASVCTSYILLLSILLLLA